MNEMLVVLFELAVASSVAIGAIALLRRPVRRLAGAEAAYWVWLLLPAAHIAVLLPAPSVNVGGSAPIVARIVDAALPEMTFEGRSAPQEARWSLMGDAALPLALWAAGALLMALVMLRRQRAFLQRVRPLTVAADGTWRSDAMRGPALVGVFRPKIVVPADFETRYEVETRALMLAHERAHARRGDALVNAVAAVWLVLLWFNPLAHWAIGRLRFDQDLACDAAALTEFAGARRRYAAALVATQLAEELPIPAFACGWVSKHPLTARVAVLKRPLPTPRLRRATKGLVCAAAACACVLMWQAAPHAQGSSPEPAQADPPSPPEYLVQAGDLLRVVVRGEEELSRTVRVRPDGKISIALVPYFIVADKTAAQVAREIERELSQFIRSPVVDVSVEAAAGEAQGVLPDARR